MVRVSWVSWLRKDMSLGLLHSNLILTTISSRLCVGAEVSIWAPSSQVTAACWEGGSGGQLGRMVQCKYTGRNAILAPLVCLHHADCTVTSPLPIPSMQQWDICQESGKHLHPANNTHYWLLYFTGSVYTTIYRVSCMQCIHFLTKKHSTPNNCISEIKPFVMVILIYKTEYTRALLQEQKGRHSQ